MEDMPFGQSKTSVDILDRYHKFQRQSPALVSPCTWHWRAFSRDQENRFPLGTGSLSWEERCNLS